MCQRRRLGFSLGLVLLFFAPIAKRALTIWQPLKSGTPHVTQGHRSMLNHARVPSFLRNFFEEISRILPRKKEKRAPQERPWKLGFARGGASVKPAASCPGGAPYSRPGGTCTKC